MRKGILTLLAFVAMAATIALPLSSTANAASPPRSLHHAFGQRGQHPNGRAANASGGNLIYNHGPVMAGTANVYAIFWQPSNSVSAGYQNLIERYFNDVGGSPLYQNNTQYTDSNGNFPSGSRLAGAWTDNRGYPGNPLFDSDIQSEVSHAQSVNGWATSPQNIFFVFTQSGQNVCFNGSNSCASNAFCAYHGAFGNNTIYALIPYAASFNCGTSHPNNDDADNSINVTSHEQMEAATDPLPSSGWADSTGAEIGDKCAWNFGQTNPDGSNVNWNGHPYIVQQEWSNASGGCTLAGNGGPPTRYYRIVNQNSGKLLSVSNMSLADGALITQWNDNGTADHNWKLV